MGRKEVNGQDRRTKYTRGVIRDALVNMLKTKPYGKITVTDLCRMAEINRGTFYIHYYDVDDVLDEVIDRMLAGVSGAIEHVLCRDKETCTHPFCQLVQENTALRPLFLDDAASERIVKRIAENSKESFIPYLMRHSQLTFEQAEAIFTFQIHGCMTINRLMLKNHCRDWHANQEVVDRFIRAGLRELLHDSTEVGI